MTGLASQLAESPPWLVRFPHPHGESAAGAGVLIGPRHVLTCAHVLEKQLGRSLPDPGLGLAACAEGVVIEFPFAGKRTRGTLADWVPIARDGSGDVALLELESPVNCTPAPLACPPTLDGHRFSVRGFPDGDPAARQANGVLRGASGESGSWVQLDAESEIGWAIEVGFSGAPVFDHSREAVVGIVVVRDKRETRTGHMLPMSYLQTLWPEVRSNCRWRLDLDANYDTHWDPRARGSEPDAPAKEWLFTGRTEARRVISEWLKGSNPDLAKQPILLVTGGPGSGKSALLAHSLVSADPLLAETVPYFDLTDPRPPIGAFDVALHLRGQTCDEVTTQLACALDVAGSDSDKLLAAVRNFSDGEQLTVLADAVEEAASLEESQKIAALLRQLTNTRRIRVLAAVRTAPAGTARRRVLDKLGRDAHLIDLEDSRYLHHPDIAEYVVRRLTSEQAESAQYRVWEPNQLRGIGEAVARKARYNFLIAQLTTGWLLRRNEQESGPSEPGWEDKLPTTVGDAMDAYLDTCAADTPKLRNLLTALAYARGDGLPRSDTWLCMADALGFGIRHSAEDREKIFDSAAHYLVERVSVDAKKHTYRLYHDALDQHLRKEKELEHPAPEDAITAALIKAVPARDGSRDWAETDAYTRHHLASHAAAAGQIDTLLTIGTEYLVQAEPRGLTPHLHLANSEPARLAAAVYRASLGIHATGTPSMRRQALALDAARAGATSLHQQLSRHIPAGHWAPLWATGNSFTPALRDTLTSKTGPVSDLMCTVLDGTPVAVSVAADRLPNFGGDCTVELWDLTTGSPMTSCNIPMCRALYALADGTPIAVTMGYDKTVRAWNLITGMPIGEPIVSHTDQIFAACTTMYGTPVAVIAYVDSRQERDAYQRARRRGGYSTVGEQGHQTDKTVRVWDLATGTQLSEFLTDHPRQIAGVACTTVDGTPVAITRCRAGKARLWDLTTGTAFRRPSMGDFRGIDFTTVNGTPVAVTDGGMLWELTTDKLWNSLRGGVLPGDGLDVACMTVDGTPIAVTVGRDNAVRVWDLVTCTQRGEPLKGHTGQVNTVACAVVRGTPVAVTGSSDSTVRIWNLTTGGPVGKPRPGHAGKVTAAAYTIVNDAPAAVTAGGDGTVRVWNLTTGGVLSKPLTSHPNGVFDIACAVVDGAPLAITGGSDKTASEWDRKATARVWDLAAGTPHRPHQFDRANVRAVAWLEGTPLCVSHDFGHVSAWNAVTSSKFGRESKFNTHARISMACMVLDGIPVAITIQDLSAWQLAQVWHLATGACIGRILLKDPGRVFSMACAVVDRTLIGVTGSTEGAVRTWNLRTGTPLGNPVTGHTGWVDAVICTVLDGQPVAVTAGRDDMVRVWNLPTGEPAGLLPVPSPQVVTPTPEGDLIVGMGTDVAVFRRRPTHTLR
ncbi:trypsin-like peptidase domain-containing protein [Streptomyces sp. NPDC056656]|uniref:trypsin-like peptidase domain-containing protein n=1 Tax=Streptomyces sp. NPDC056656 TaxID=3345895 RepID=UPI003678D7A4